MGTRGKVQKALHAWSLDLSWHYPPSPKWKRKEGNSRIQRKSEREFRNQGHVPCKDPTVTPGIKWSPSIAKMGGKWAPSIRVLSINLVCWLNGPLSTTYGHSLTINKFIRKKHIQQCFSNIGKEPPTATWLVQYGVLTLVVFQGKVIYFNTIDT